MKYLLKNCLIPFSIVFTSFATHAQSWTPLGSRGFSAGEVEYTSLALDTGGTPYIAFQDVANGYKATVMKYSSGSWVNVGSPGFSIGGVDNTSIAISNSGTPYVAFWDDAATVNGAATVMKFNGAGWEYVGIEGFSAFQAANLSIAIDAGGTPYVVYSDDSGFLFSKATVKKYDGSTWVNVGAPRFSEGNAGWTSIAIDASGTPYVAYQDDSNAKKATVMKFNGSSWIAVGGVGFSAGEADFTSIAIDTGGTPYVLYEDHGKDDKATVMKYSAGNWVTVGIPGFSAGAVYWPSIAIDPFGTPYVAYQDSVDTDYATVMKFNGSDWVTVGLEGFSAGEAFYTSIAINGQGTPFIGYDDAGVGAATVVGLSPAVITGIDTVCAGTTTDLTDTTSGGIWSSSNTSIALVSSGTGIVTAVAAGVDTISYTISGVSSTFAVSVNSCTSSIKNITTATALNISPNPAHNVLTLHISFPQNEDATIIITNMLGEKVKEFISYTNTDTQIQLNEPPGVYFISAVMKDGTATSKILLE
jgi:hypothetical protein